MISTWHCVPRSYLDSCILYRRRGTQSSLGKPCRPRLTLDGILARVLMELLAMPLHQGYLSRTFSLSSRLKGSRTLQVNLAVSTSPLQTLAKPASPPQTRRTTCRVTCAGPQAASRLKGGGTEDEESGGDVSMAGFSRGRGNAIMYSHVTAGTKSGKLSISAAYAWKRMAL